MTDKENQKEEDPPPAANLDDFWVMDYEMRTFSEILRDWLPELLPWRKKKRKRP